MLFGGFTGLFVTSLLDWDCLCVFKVGCDSLTLLRDRGLGFDLTKLGDYGLVFAVYDFLRKSFSSNLRCIVLNISAVTSSPIFGLNE